MSISRSTFLVAVVVASAVTSAAGADDLASAVAGKLSASQAVKGHKVNVRAKAGTVFLEGQVGSAGQIAAAEAAAKSTDGVEMVVNRLTVAEAGSSGLLNTFAIPSSIRSAVGMGAKARPEAPQSEAPGEVQLTQAVGMPRSGRAPAGPRPLGAPQARPMQPHAAQRGPVGQQTVAMRQPMNLPGPGAYQGAVNGAIGDMGGVPGGLRDGQVVPGSVRYTEGGPGGPGGLGGQAPYGGGAPYVGSPGMAPMGPGMAGPGGGMGAPMPARGMGVGAGAVPMRGDGPNMPNYAWPSYAASPNYAAVQYPTQYSPTAWPYIGPFYPYPQVPLGWRRVSLEWDDGWWWLDFDERHIHSHHR
jgi:hypothetical protein